MSFEDVYRLTPLVAEGDLQTLLYAIGLLLLGLALLVLEIFVVSFGLLLIAAIGCAGGAIYLGFVASDVAGWILTGVTPVAGVIIFRWGIRRIQRSRVVPQSEITSEAGYHHVADRIGVAVGSVGTLVTAARPSGRARFEGGECDVQVRGGSLERDDEVIVRRIDGPIIFVAPAEIDGEAEDAGTKNPDPAT